MTYGVSDGIASTPASVSWTVTGTNDAPVAVADASRGAEDAPSPARSRANDSDVDDGETRR